MIKTGIGIGVLVLFTLIISEAHAQSWQSEAFETTDQARQRHSAERYQQQQQRYGMPPLGGYQEKLGDTAPRGTWRPGYTSPQGSGYGSGRGDARQDRWR